MDGQDERLESVAVDIDTRLTDIWLTITEPGGALAHADEGVRELMGAALRAAYVEGYIDALREDRAGRRAELHRTHGFKPE